ncbi:MAG: HDOD domain-containing protein [Ectothiorhodospiraceae bacterium]|nr:HDOD domain-containing protein [Ectothiorhodospiraceae bacterium]
MVNFWQRIFSPAQKMQDTQTNKTPVNVPNKTKASPEVSDATTPVTNGTEKTTSPLALKNIGNDFYRYLLGVDSFHDGPVSALEKTIIDSVDTLMQSQKEAANLIPRMPGVVPQLMQKIRADDYDGKEITEIINTDPVVMAEVLRLANSPFFRARNPAKNLADAVLQLGQSGLREVIMSVAMKPIMQVGKGFTHQHAAKSIWEQSLKVAVACRSLAKAEGVDRFNAYVAGLMHNTGSMVVLRQFDQAGKPMEPQHSRTFQHSVIQRATKLTFIITEQWGLPEEVVTALKEQFGSHRRRPATRLGRIVEMGTRLGQIQALSENGRIDDPDSLVTLLSKQENGGNAVQAYTEMGVIEGLG